MKKVIAVIIENDENEILCAIHSPEMFMIASKKTKQKGEI